jgi:hypothetical protein
MANNTATCSNCKWWGEIAQVSDGMNYCVLASRHAPSVSRSIAFEFDGKAVGWLTTTASFGCNQHEPKDTESKQVNDHD